MYSDYKMENIKIPVYRNMSRDFISEYYDSDKSHHNSLKSMIEKDQCNFSQPASETVDFDLHTKDSTLISSPFLQNDVYFEAEMEIFIKPEFYELNKEYIGKKLIIAYVGDYYLSLNRRYLDGLKSDMIPKNQVYPRNYIPRKSNDAFEPGDHIRIRDEFQYLYNNSFFILVSVYSTCLFAKNISACHIHIPVFHAEKYRSEYPKTFNEINHIPAKNTELYSKMKGFPIIPGMQSIDCKKYEASW